MERISSKLSSQTPEAPYFTQSDLVLNFTHVRPWNLLGTPEGVPNSAKHIQGFKKFLQTNIAKHLSFFYFVFLIYIMSWNYQVIPSFVTSIFFIECYQRGSNKSSTPSDSFWDF
jgi:hypothetical protein